MLDKSKRYLIVGLGLLGGKYALELTRAGYTVDGINRSEGHLQFALDHGYIRSGKTHEMCIRDSVQPVHQRAAVRPAPAGRGQHPAPHPAGGEPQLH